MKNINVYVTSGILLLTVGFHAVSDSIDFRSEPIGWNAVFSYAQEFNELTNYVDPSLESDLYSQRDYFRNSKYSQITYDIYKFWDDIILNETTVPMISGFLSVYNQRIYQLMYNQDPSREMEVFIDQELYNKAMALLDYHAYELNSPSFDDFRKEVIVAMQSMQGKTYIQVREELFGIGPTCDSVRINAGLCN